MYLIQVITFNIFNMKPVSGVRGLEPRSSHREAKGQSLLIVTVQARLGREIRGRSQTGFGHACAWRELFGRQYSESVDELASISS